MCAHASQIQSRALTSHGLLGRLSMHLDSAYPRPIASGKDFQFVLFADRSRDQRPGHHRAKAFHGENPVNGQARQCQRVPGGGIGSGLCQRQPKLIESRAGKRTNGNNRRLRWIEKRIAHKIFDLQPHHVQGFAVHQIGFGQDDNASPHREQAADIEMLAGLRLDGFVGCDHQQHQIDSTDPRQHVAHEALVPGNVDEPEPDGVAAGKRQFQVRETDVNGDATALFFFQSISIDPGESFHQCGFSVIDVSRGADDDGLHSGQYSSAPVSALPSSAGLWPARWGGRDSPNRRRRDAGATYATIVFPHMTTSSALVITPEIIREHGLTPDEYEKIKQLLGGRVPTITELGIFSVMWSEHCSYKSSRVHLKRLPTRSRLVVQGPGENAGIIDIGDGWACAFKIESHNHPSFIEPFQGAATGVGGILRDIFTMGARPVAVMDSLRFGPIAPSCARRVPDSPSRVRDPSPHNPRKKFTRISPCSKAWSAGSHRMAIVSV